MKVLDSGHTLLYGRSVEPCVEERKGNRWIRSTIKPEDRMKFEIAKELGLADKVVAGGWRCTHRKGERHGSAVL